MATGKFVGYYRVSTRRQGESGLGLEAQKETISCYLNGGNWELIGEFTEIESGKKDDRPELSKALQLCRITGATLIIAKLDRLARNVAFISRLMEGGVDFIACDFPQANRLTVHIIAAVAEHEREMISKRTREALAAKKARGERLGTPGNITPAVRAAAQVKAKYARMEKADRFALQVGPVAAELRAEGKGLRMIATAMNGRNILTPRGKAGTWTQTAVKNLLTRLDRLTMSIAVAAPQEHPPIMAR